MSAIKSTERLFRFAACQLAGGADKVENLSRARAMISRAAQEGAKVVCLPEMFNCPYSNASFPVYAESASPPESSLQMLSEAAKAHGIYLVGGSIPERDAEGRLFNTSFVFGPQGERVAAHRKVHLFDIDIPGQITFRESDTLAAGDAVTSFDTPFGRFGLAICYDLRFWELSAAMARQRGCHFLLFPGAFNTTTGPLHWELLLRARAVDHQLFVAGVAPARVEGAGYQSWGHSTVVDPWGKVIAATDEKEGLVLADIDMDIVQDVRKKIPVRTQRREDVYSSVSEIL